jgi:hypothetical protein
VINFGTGSPEGNGGPYSLCPPLYATVESRWDHHFLVWLQTKTLLCVQVRAGPEPAHRRQVVSGHRRQCSFGVFSRTAYWSRRVKSAFYDRETTRHDHRTPVSEITYRRKPRSFRRCRGSGQCSGRSDVFTGSVSSGSLLFLNTQCLDRAPKEHPTYCVCSEARGEGGHAYVRKSERFVFC